MRQSKAKSVSNEFIKKSPPIFYCGDKTRKIKGIPVDGIVKNASDSLLIINLTHGFKYPLLPSQQDDLVLIRRDEAIKYENKLDHELLLDSFLALNSRFHKHKVIQVKKPIIAAYQDGSFCKYMTPGVFPKRAGHGTAVRALFDLEECHHQALLRYVNQCETLAMKSMSKEVASGLNKAELMFPYPTFPGCGTGCPNSRIFSSIATAHNVCLNSHTDDDAIYGVVTNLDSDPTIFQVLTTMSHCILHSRPLVWQLLFVPETFYSSTQPYIIAFHHVAIPNKTNGVHRCTQRMLLPEAMTICCSLKINKGR
jgi:hypothetical protein